ncbi:MAG: Mrp/NBP35 family ATP-binding protein [Lachnospiraceae bacterium]|nr:Mrp/NBP35 family ATP-binding protein [Lachnospiraceae bacterium]
MADECTHDCSSCSASCSSREGGEKVNLESFREKLNENSKVRKVIGVISGKGGVGKSFVTSYLAVLMNKKGYKVGILDADITGPSVPAAFNIHEKATGNELGIIPAKTKNGIDLISINLMLKTEDAPVIWRGPVIAGVVKQFWTDVFWDDIDFLFVDMPPGTGDVPLTVFQSIPVDGVVVVTSPQTLVSTIVSKAVNMANEMNVPIIGLVENYSYVECPKCKERINVFGESHVEEIARKFGLTVLDRVPMTPVIAEKIDTGAIEDLEGTWLNETADFIESQYVMNDED